MPQIAIIDYGMGNLLNVQFACTAVGLKSVITSDKNVISHSNGIILPGVGAFPDAMGNLKKLDLAGVIKDQVESKKPFLGVCLGMQLLFTESDEFGGHPGLDIIKGKVIRFNNKKLGSPMIKVPQVGWNRIHFKENQQEREWFPLQGISNGEYMYFVHSYYAVPEDSSVILTMTNYENIEYCSSVLKEAVFAAQFHPEKSGVEGLKIYKNWANIVHSNEELVSK